MEIYETQARSLLRRLTSRDRSQWPLKRVETAINELNQTAPKANLEGRYASMGVMLNDIRASLNLGEKITVLVGKPPRKKRTKGPRKHALTIPYRAGRFLRKRYGDNWTGEMTEADWTAFAEEMGYDASRVSQARAALTAVFHGIRGWMDK